MGDRDNRRGSAEPPPATQSGTPATGAGDAAANGDGIFGIGTVLAGRIHNEYLAGLLLLVGGAIYGAVKTSDGAQWGFVVVALLLSVVVAAVLLFRLLRPPERPRRRFVDTVALAQRLSQDQKDDVMTCLRGAVNGAAAALNVTEGHVRGNLFGIDRQRALRILPDLTINMDPQSLEMTLRCRLGQGSTGRCYQSRLANIAVFSEGWGSNVLPQDEEAKLNADLQWVISVPVLPLDAEDGSPSWVLNVDGLHERKTESELGRALSAVLPYPSLIARIISEGRR